MRLTELVKDPFPDFGEDEGLSPAESEGRQAMREILEDLVAAGDDAGIHEELRQVLASNLDAA